MLLDTSQLKILLIGSNLITPDQFDQAEKESKLKNIALEVCLPQNGYIKDVHLGQIIANYLKVKFVDLKNEPIDHATQMLVSEAVATKQQVVLFKQDEKNIYLGTSNPNNHDFFSLIKKKTNKNIIVYYATSLSILDALKNYKVLIKTSIEGLIKHLQAGPTGATETSIIQIVSLLLENAYDSRASDIHIEPMREEVSVRFRIDGVLHEVVRYPKTFHDNVVSRVKILAKLSIDEHAAAQDGRFSYSQGATRFDVRVSVLPITEGENIVLRLLADSTNSLFLDSLGLFSEDMEKLKRASLKPYGMILAVGPTGAGKTTTLYSLLHILNRPEVNIMTIEDPVEYNMEHVQQSQVNAKKKLTFASGLRSIVRQDPDIIMVGEIRDEETAGIAVNAAMTGHLVLSTLHANDAATTFPRLLDMGIEPFLVGSSVNIIISQRLVRKVCEKCKESYNIDENKDDLLKSYEEIKQFLLQFSTKEDISQIRFYHGKGCNICNNTGYHGRTGIFEVLEMNEALRSLISKHADSNEIYKCAATTGMTSMLQDGIRKVLQGVTTLEEVIRATKT